MNGTGAAVPAVSATTDDVLVREIGTWVEPEALMALLDDGAGAVWSDPGGPGGHGFLGLTSEPTDVLILDGADRVTSDPRAGSLFGLDALAAVLRARLRASRTRSPRLGWWGLIGYEAGARALGVPAAPTDGPAAAFVLVDRGVEVDERTGRLTLLVDAHAPDAESWLTRTAARLSRVSPGTPVTAGPAGSARRRLGRAAYLEQIAACLDAIRRGDAYQLCLTSTIDVELPADLDPLGVYARLRRTNPAPYGGVLRVGDRWLLSASPERFLTVDARGRAATTPIKGTRRRHLDPVTDRALADELAADEKERAENVMIVDLCRNDLSRVSRTGSVQVSELLVVQSHPHVHQLVSTVESELVTDAIGAALALFPAGSMTGAPKLSAMALLAGLEVGPRGGYAGVWGRFSGDGSADLAVVIRSIEIRPGVASIGTGGGITALSEAGREWDETVLKAGPALAALGAR